MCRFGFMVWKWRVLFKYSSPLKQDICWWSCSKWCRLSHPFWNSWNNSQKFQIFPGHFRHVLICCHWNEGILFYCPFVYFACCWSNMASLWDSDNEIPAIVLFSFFDVAVQGEHSVCPAQLWSNDTFVCRAKVWETKPWSQKNKNTDLSQHNACNLYENEHVQLVFLCANYLHRGK